MSFILIISCYCRIMPFYWHKIWISISNCLNAWFFIVRNNHSLNLFIFFFISSFSFSICIQDIGCFLIKIGINFSNLTQNFMWFYLACICLLYTSDAADDLLCVDLGGR